MLYKKLHKEILVANELKVSQTDVNKTLSAAHGRVYLEARETLNQFLQQFSSGQ